ncbi:MAG TPA: chemotaxis protein CheW, partial [Comamonas sp.]
SYVWVFDLHEVLTGKRSRITAQSQVLVLQLGTRKLGVLVCDLHGVHAFAQDSIIPMPSLRDTEPLLIQTLIKANHGALLLQCIDPQSLLQILQTPSAPRTTAPPLDCATVL